MDSDNFLKMPVGSTSYWHLLLELKKKQNKKKPKKLKQTKHGEGTH